MIKEERASLILTGTGWSLDHIAEQAAESELVRGGRVLRPASTGTQGRGPVLIEHASLVPTPLGTHLMQAIVHAADALPFSCKQRGFCPSCGARRMAESAALLVDEVSSMSVNTRRTRCNSVSGN